jgi:hypothetical protein
VAVDVDKRSSEDRPLVTYIGKTGGEVAFSLLPGSIAFMDDQIAPLFIDRDDAIDMAKRVLRAYEVPFCNRIEKAGTVG